MTLHWLMAAALLFQMALGWRTVEAESALHTVLLRAHRSVGMAILLLSLARLGLRLVSKPTLAEDSTPRLEHLASKIVHAAFYVLMIGLPLSGWALASSTHGRSPWTIFGVMPWIDLPVPARLAAVFETTHSASASLLLGLFALHVLAALKHHFLDRDQILSRMLPGLPGGKLLAPSLLLPPLALSGAVALPYLPNGPVAPPARPPVSRLEAADVYLDLVEPMLARRCLSCHNEDQSRGGLSVATHSDLMAGGDSGREGELLKRITLAPDHEGFMPRGKTPLKDDQIRIIQWWASIGAPSRGTLAEQPRLAEVRPAVLHVLGLGNPGHDTQEDGLDGLPTGLHAPDPTIVQQLEAQGFVVRPVVAGSAWVDVDFNAPMGVSDVSLALLARIGRQIRDLNLRAADLRDKQLKVIGGFENLHRLRIEGNGISDTGIQHLSGLRMLSHLNLVHTRVTDGSVAALCNMKSLRQVHAWDSGISAAGVSVAQRNRPELQIHLGSPPLPDP